MTGVKAGPFTQTHKLAATSLAPRLSTAPTRATLPTLIALCFHKVGPIEQEGRRLNIEPSRLESIIRWLLRRGAQFTLPKDADLSNPKTACLTFDDGFESTCTHGVEAMEREGVRGAIYIVSNCVGLVDDWEGASSRPLSGWETLRDLEKRGFEIGCHTDRHPRLAALALEEQERSIAVCRDAMTANGLKAATFCYPYGSWNHHSPALVEKAGFRLGWALGKRMPARGDSPFALPRIVVAFSDGPASLAYKMWVKPRIYRLAGRSLTHDPKR